jgi:uncharacterized protein (TIGR03083 family)
MREGVAMDASKLADLDPFGIFDAESARLDRFFSTLPEDAWARPSRCEGWSVRDVLAHLAGEETYNHACLDGDLEGFFALLQSVGVGGFGDFGDFNEWCVRQRAGIPVQQVLGEWRTASAETYRRMHDLGRDGTLQTSAGPYPAGLQMFHYASEYATHADDIGAPVDPGEEHGRTSWRARFGCFALSEHFSPAEAAQTGHGYRVQVADVIAEVSAHDFVEATVGRLPEDHPLDKRLRDGLRCLA